MAETVEVDRVDEVVQMVSEVLGSVVVGIYLHGSAALGGLRLASDLDILVVARRRTDGQARRFLLEGLLRLAASGGRSIELTVVARPDIQPWRYPPVVDFHYGDWMRDELAVAGPPSPRPLPDLALQLANVLASDHALVGPPPARVLSSVPRADLIRASVAGLPELLADLDHDTRNVLLTMARVWSTIVTGEIRTKDAAVDWAARRLPAEHRAVLEYAKGQYLHRGYAADDWNSDRRARARRCVETILADIGRP